MIFKNLSLTTLFSLLYILTFSQSATVKGRLLDKNTVETIANTRIEVAETEIVTFSAMDGTFVIEMVPFGEQKILFSNKEGQTSSITIIVDQAEIDLGDVMVVKDELLSSFNPEDLIPTISLDESSDNAIGADNISGILTASRDAYISTAAFTFGTYRFRIRGYDSENTAVSMNNITMNDLETGRPLFAQWSGLNDVMRNQNLTVGLGHTDYSFGGVGGATNIDSRAGSQWKQFRASYSASNRTYFHRLMATYSTGRMDNDWAFSVAASRRWAQEGYVQGTFYDAYSYFASVEKFFGNKNRLSLTTFGAPSTRGRQTASFQEVNDLMDNNLYNPNWGYQNGEVRNSRVGTTHLPTFILTNEWTINNSSSLTASGSYQFGRNGTTALNWYNAPDPRPDYYRNLPSFQTDPLMRELVREAFISNPALNQVNWDGMYQANSLSFETIENVNGSGETQTVNLSRYVIEDRRNDLKKANGTLLYSNKLSQNITLNSGFNYNWQQTSNYNKVADLLGGEYFIDYNQFAVRDFPDNNDIRQNDLNRPNRLLKEGDRYGHDYLGTTHFANTWLQGVFKYKKVDFFAAAEASNTVFWRTGNVRSGVFPENSFGDSEKQRFFNYGVKGGITYKINGRNYVFANGSYGTRAPFLRNSFVAPRSRNEVAKNLQSEEIISFEGGYILRSPKLKGRAVFYYAEFRNQIKSGTFYYEGSGVLGNYVMNGIGKRHLGGEFALDIDVAKGFSLTPVAAVGQHIYSSRPNLTLTRDNTAEVIFENETTYLKNFFLGNGPQMAGTLGLNYRSPKYWFVSLNLNYFDRIFTDIDPFRRTASSVETVAPESELFYSIIKQEQLSGQFTMDLFAGYSWKIDKTFNGLKNSQFLYFNVGVSNLTNNTKFATGGFEQLRFTVEDTDRFPSRYFYNFGTNFFASITYRL
jgi:hypothetical protein